MTLNKVVSSAAEAVAHNIKGQGSSFGFPLMTRLGDSLCRARPHSTPTGARRGGPARAGGACRAPGGVDVPGAWDA